MSIRQGNNIIAGGNSGRSVGDIFLTMRNDNELNGAVECNGATYNTTDFIGAQSIGNLLAAGKVPYLSLTDYATALATDGSVGVFGWDGAGTSVFRVPTLTDIFVETGTAAQIGDYIAPELPDHNHTITQPVYWGSRNTYVAAHWTADDGIMGADATATSSMASASNQIYKDGATVQPNAVRYRAMVQLAVSATDEALETCTGVLADVAALKYDYVVDFQAPTAQNNYTWYRKYKSGWVEQGGQTSVNTGGSAVTLPVPMADTNYSITCSLKSISTTHGSGGYDRYPGANDMTTTGFWMEQPQNANYYTCWEVAGIAA